MKTAFFSTIAALAALTTAIPDAPSKIWKNPRGRTVISYVAKFDDANAGVLPGAPVRGVTPLGPYDSLYYSNMGVISDNTVAAGVPAVSKPNVLAYDLVAEGQGPQNITSRYTNSITDYFNFKSFYFGCLLSTEETASSVPVSCTIDMTGYLNGRQVATQSASFKASGLQTNMQFVQLGRGFGAVDTVAFKTEGVVGETLLGTLFDNMAYDAVLKPGYSYQSH